MSFPRYEAYAESGVEWLGEVPTHWKTMALKRAYSVVGGSTPKSDIDSFWDGDIVWITPADLSRLRGFVIDSSIKMITTDGLASCGTCLVPAGSVVLSTRAPIGSLGIANRDLCTNQGCKSLVPGIDQFSKYLAYCLSVATGQLNVRGKGTTFLEISGDELGAFKLPFPQQSEQRDIVDFLDRETAKIDALVEEQRRLIALLKEKRQAVISHAVTKGLDPNAPMKDSGVEWLGEVPANWEVVALKHLVSTSIIDGPHVSPQKYDEGIPFISAEALSKGYINFEYKWGYISPEAHEEYSKRYKPKRGDILMVKLGATTGTVGIVETDEEFNTWVPLAGIRLKSDSNPYFVLRVLQSSNLKVAYELSWTFGTQQTLGLGTISNLRIPTPPYEEQLAIVKRLDSMLPHFESLTAEAQQAIALLQERRSALISAAVTGKIDVRGLVPIAEAAE